MAFEMGAIARLGLLGLLFFVNGSEAVRIGNCCAAVEAAVAPPLQQKRAMVQV